MLPFNMWIARLWHWLRGCASRVAEFALRARRDRRLAEEIQTHLDELAAGYENAGLSPADARAAARRAFGSVTGITQAYREARGVAVLESLVQDTKVAARRLLADRWYSLAGATALALGIAVGTTVFTMVNGIALQRLPVEDADRVVYVVTGEPRGRAQSSYADLLDWQRTATSFTGLAAFADGVVTIGDGQRAAQRLAASYVTANAFDVLGEQPVIGRGLRDDDDRPGAAAVALLAHGVWMSRFGGDPAVVGRTVRIDSAPVTIVGVMRDGFRFPVLTDVWRPLGAWPALDRDAREQRTINVFGRLRDGVTISAASAEMAAIAQALAATYVATNAGTRVEVMRFTERYGGRLTEWTPLVLLTAVGIVLLIACTNAAMLLLARAAPRAREMALRAAMGASRTRLVRQLLVESLLLSLAAGTVGFLAAVVAVRALRVEAVDLNLPFWMQFVFDARVFTFVAAICVLTAVLSGLAPAWYVSGARAQDLLKDGARGLAGGRRAQRWTGALLVAELALTLMLLAGAGLLLQSARALQESDHIVDPATLFSARLALPTVRYPAAGDRRRFYERLEIALAANPPTASAALTTGLPFSSPAPRPIRIDGHGDTGTSAPTAVTVAVSDGYFTTLGLPLLRGRTFGPGDRPPEAHSAIVNQRFVDQYLSDRDAIGRQIQLTSAPASPAAASAWLTVVGIAPTFRLSPMSDAHPAVFVPLQAQPGPAVAVVVRHVAGAPPAAALIEAVRSIDADAALFGMMPLSRLSELSRFNHRMMSAVLAIIAAIALFLSMIGLYGITAFGVTQRTSELGVRVALGAAHGTLLWQVVGRTVAHVVSGLVLGLAGAVALGQLLVGLLIQTAPLDPISFAAAILLLTGVALAACLIPARRALRLDPIAALRHE